MYSGRKPYFKAKDSIVEFFKTPVRYLKDLVLKESQFEKPYMEDDYQAMHLDLPTPGWPSWDFGYKVDRPSWDFGYETDRPWARPLLPPEELPIEEEEYPFLGREDKPYISCSYTLHQQYCQQVIDAGLDVEDAGVTAMQMYPNSVLPYSPVSHFWTFEGAGLTFVTNVVETAPMVQKFAQVSPQALSHRISFNWNTELAALVPGCYAYTTLCYNIVGICKHCLDISDTNCCEECCPAEVTFEFDDDNTPDTIVAGNSIDVYVLGGCAPFTYAVSGTGYTWNANGTSSYQSENRNEQLDCAAGT